MNLIAITGGIGSGKSVVSRLLRLMGYGVYDTDSRARFLMEHDEVLIESIQKEFGDDVYSFGKLNRNKLSELVFRSPEKLHKLNAIVHPAVISDSLKWLNTQGNIAFIETAIPYSSGYDKIVSQIWKVVAPEDVRIHRVMKRNGLDEKQIQDRINAQKGELIDNEKDTIIFNDGKCPLLPQLINALKSCS